MKKLFLVILSVFVSLLIMGGYSQAAPEKPIKLIFTHFEPPAGVGGSSAIEFCKELEEKTGGRVKAETALAGSLGPVPEQFELVATGAADIGGFIPAYTPGRFPLFSLMVELPHKVDKTVPLTKAYNELIRKGYFDKEFEPTKLLWVSSVPPLQLFWANERIATLEGLKGKKIRTSGEFWLAVAPKLGMVPVSMTIADIYSALEKGTVDGTLLPFSTMDVYKIREVTKYAMELNLTYNCFACAMNKAVYEKLPKDIRDIIDKLAQKYGDIEAWKHDEWDRKGKKNFLAMTGREAYPTQETEWKKILGVLKPLSEEWVSKREAKGYPARQLMEDLRSTLNKYGVTEAIID